MKYVCDVCGWEYDEEKGYPEGGIAPGTKWEIIPRQKQVFDWKTCKNVADFFAKIVDYKSSFTSRHSIEAAEKAAFHHEKLNGKGYPFGNIRNLYINLMNLWNITMMR